MLSEIELVYSRKAGKKWYDNNREFKLKRCQDATIKRREKLFDILGHICNNCGFSDKRALQFDHINGGGTQDLKKFKHHRDMIRFYINDPLSAKRNLQVLCANCNWIKRRENNEESKGVKA